MRTLLALLAALLLLASQARAQALQEAAGQVPAQDPPVAKDQDLPVEEDEDEDEDEGVSISFMGADRFARTVTGTEVAAAVLRRCRCRRRRRCRGNRVNKVLERFSGTCKIFGRRRKLCCR